MKNVYVVKGVDLSGNYPDKFRGREFVPQPAIFKTPYEAEQFCKNKQTKRAFYYWTPMLIRDYTFTYQCPFCGYKETGHPKGTKVVCPECGWVYLQEVDNSEDS